MCFYKMAVLSLFLTCILAAETVPVKLACIGNSITSGAGSKISYPEYLAKLLGSTYEVKNFGLSSTTMLKKGDGPPYWNTKQFKDLFDFKPDLVTIVLGSNDAEDGNWKYHGEFKKDYSDFIDTLNKITSKPRIFPGLPPPMIRKKRRNENIKAYIEIIKEIAKERSLTVIDLYTPLVEHPEYFPDGVHPNDAGSEALAKVMYKALINTRSITRVLLGKPVHVQGNRTFPWIPILSGSLISGTARDLLGRKIMDVRTGGVKVSSVPKLLILQGAPDR